MGCASHQAGRAALLWCDKLGLTLFIFTYEMVSGFYVIHSGGVIILLDISAVGLRIYVLAF